MVSDNVVPGKVAGGKVVLLSVVAGANVVKEEVVCGIVVL